MAKEESSSSSSSSSKADDNKKTGADAASNKDGKKPGDKKILKQELTEEDLAKKAEVDLLAERVQDPDAGVQKLALDTLREEIRTSTASMTSIPLTLKFLRPHYTVLKQFYETLVDGDNKCSLADLLSVLAMSMAAQGSRESLKFKVQGNIHSFLEWGHEYVRNLAGEIADEFAHRQNENLPIDDIMEMVDAIIPFNMSHNGEPEACDLLLEVEQLDKILRYTDISNYNRVCLYLLSNANYAPEPEDKEILRIVLRIYLQVGKLTDALVVAMKLNDLEEISKIYQGAEGAVKKQLALMLGRQHVFTVPEEEPELLDLIGNTRSSKHFLLLAKDLDVLEPKLPEDIYKTHLLDSRFASNLAHDSAKQNLASTFVNAFVNAGFQTDRLMTDPSRSWLHKHKDQGKMSAAASLGMIYLGDVDEGPGKMDPFTSIDDEWIPGGALLGIGIFCSGVHSEYDPALALLRDHVSSKNKAVKIGAILGLGYAYAGKAHEEIRQELLGPMLDEAEEDMDVLGFLALALGLIFIGTGNDEIAGSILSILQIKEGTTLTSTHTRFLSLGLGLLYFGKQGDADVTLQILSTLTHEPTRQYGINTVETCAYAGTGNVLKIQKLLHACGAHLETDNEFQGVAVIGIALIAMAEEIGAEMSLRTFDHLLQYGEPVIRRAVPLALGLLSVSNPRLTVMDTLSKLSHDSDADVAQGAILGLGLIGAGTNNSRIAQLLRQLSAYYSKEANQLFIVRIAQGLLHLGKGTLTLNPYHAHNLLLSHTAVAGLLIVLHASLDLKNLIHGQYHYLLYSIVVAMVPRMLLTVDENLEPLPVSVRVGQAVDTVGQAGRPKTITGFQTHTTPVLLGNNERAELATDEYIPLSSFLEGVVILQQNPDATGAVTA